MSDILRTIQGDCLEALKGLEDESVNTCVTSPPYFGLRDYGVAGQIGLEETPEAYVSKLVEVFREVRRVLRKDGTCWINLGDSYSGGASRGSGPQVGKQATNRGTDFLGGRKQVIHEGYKPKDLLMIPARVALALQADSWYLRSDIIWNKPNPMPESVTDRPTKSHEYIFLLSKSERYYYDQAAIKEPAKDTSIARLGRGVSDSHKNIDGAPGQTPHTLSQPRSNVRFGGNKAEGYGTRIHSGNEWRPSEDAYVMVNKKTVWTVPTKGYSDAHFATFPPELITPCILAGSPVGGTVLDPFGGSGTTGKVAIELGRKAILIELNPEYHKLIEKRCTTTIGLPLTA